MKTHNEYVKVMRELVDTLDFDAAAFHGVKAFSIFSLFGPSLNLPRSFVPGAMHQWYNLFKHLFDWYRGKFLKDELNHTDDQWDHPYTGNEATDNSPLQSLFDRVSRNGADGDDAAPVKDGETKKEKAKPSKAPKFVQSKDPFCIPPAVWDRIGNDMDLTAKEGLIPGDFGIQVRSIAAHSHEFKAEEWENWALRYAPIYLHGKLPEPFYSEFVFLTRVVRISKRYSLLPAHIEFIRNGLIRFLKHYEEHYYQYKEERLPAMKPVIHQLIHIATSIEDTGPPYVGCELFIERTCGDLARGCKSRSNIYRNISLNILRAERFNHLRFTYSIDELRAEATTDPLNANRVPTGANQLDERLGNISTQYNADEIERLKLSGYIRKMEEKARSAKETFNLHVKASEIAERELRIDMDDGKRVDRMRLCAWYYKYLIRTAKKRGLDSMLPGFLVSEYIHQTSTFGRPRIARLDRWVEFSGSTVTVPLTSRFYDLMIDTGQGWEKLPFAEAKDNLKVVKFPTVDYWNKGQVRPDLSLVSSTMPRENRTRTASLVYCTLPPDDSDDDQEIGPGPDIDPEGFELGGRLIHIAEVLYLFTIVEKEKEKEAGTDGSSGTVALSPALDIVLRAIKPINAGDEDEDQDDEDQEEEGLHDLQDHGHADLPPTRSRSSKKTANRRPRHDPAVAYALIRLIFTDPVPNSELRVVAKDRPTSAEMVVNLEDIHGLIGLALKEGNAYPVVEDGPMYSDRFNFFHWR